MLKIEDRCLLDVLNEHNTAARNFHRAILIFGALVHGRIEGKDVDEERIDDVGTDVVSALLDIQTLSFPRRAVEAANECAELLQQALDISGHNSTGALALCDQAKEVLNEALAYDDPENGLNIYAHTRRVLADKALTFIELTAE